MEVDAEGGDVEMKDAADVGDSGSGSGGASTAPGSGLPGNVLPRAKAVEVLTQIADLECDIVKRVAQFVVNKVRPAESIMKPAVV